MSFSSLFRLLPAAALAAVLVGAGSCSSDDGESCFDPLGCFLAAGPVATTPGEPGAPFFDAGACTIELNGADPARLNLAVVTADAGVCTDEDQCFTPLDRDGPGASTTATSIRLADAACAQLRDNPHTVRLFQSHGLCRAKTQADAVCAYTPGKVYPLFARDWATTAGTSFGASAAGVERFRLDPENGRYARRAEVVSGSPTGRMPWRAGAGGDLANGTRSSYSLSLADERPATLSATQHPVAVVAALSFSESAPNNALYTGTVAVGADGSLERRISSAHGSIGVDDASFSGVTAVGFASGVLVATSAGLVYCARGVTGETQLADHPCTAASPLPDGARVSAFVRDPGSTGNGAFALTDRALFALSFSRSAIVATKLLDGDFAPVVDETGSYARGLAATRKCVLFSGAAGLSYFSLALGRGAVFASSIAGQPILGLGVREAPRNAHAEFDSPIAILTAAAYGRASEGGGFYEVALPTDCL